MISFPLSTGTFLPRLHRLPKNIFSVDEYISWQQTSHIGQPKGIYVRFAAFRSGRSSGLAVQLPSGEFRGLLTGDAHYPGDLGALIAAGTSSLRLAADTLRAAAPIDPDSMTF